MAHYNLLYTTYFNSLTFFPHKSSPANRPQASLQHNPNQLDLHHLGRRITTSTMILLSEKLTNNKCVDYYNYFLHCAMNNILAWVLLWPIYENIPRMNSYIKSCININEPPSWSLSASKAIQYLPARLSRTVLSNSQFDTPVSDFSDLEFPALPPRDRLPWHRTCWHRRERESDWK